MSDVAPAPVRPIRIVKLGGSLLARQDLPRLLSAWLANQDDCCNLVLCGGGPLVDALRELARTCPIDDETAHWSAIRLMDELARLVASRVIALPLETIGDGPLPDHNCLLLGHDWFRSRSQLPHSWEVTSDSLAAELATSLGAAELILLKSALPASPLITDWVAGGFVDRWFARAAAGVSSVQVVDLPRGIFIVGKNEFS